MSGRAEGFEYRTHGDGPSTEVVINHHGRRATVLRGSAAQRFLADIEDLQPGDAQQAMARATGNYRRGNERTARNHPRNR